jgi:hypothetical protein
MTRMTESNGARSPAEMLADVASFAARIRAVYCDLTDSELAMLLGEVALLGMAVDALERDVTTRRSQTEARERAELRSVQLAREARRHERPRELHLLGLTRSGPAS